MVNQQTNNLFPSHVKLLLVLQKIYCVSISIMYLMVDCAALYAINSLLSKNPPLALAKSESYSFPNRLWNEFSVSEPRS